MKTLVPTLLALIVLPLSAAPPKGDAFEEGMRQAFADYKAGRNEAVTAKLRELIKLVEDRNAGRVGSLLPDRLNGWTGETLKREDMAILGGGLSISRTYVSTGNRTLTVKVVKDSSLVKQLIPLLTNEKLVRASNRKTHRISGETAVMDGDQKLQLVLDQRIFVELTGGETVGESDLVAAARALDLRALAAMK
jgi:hypothetical protein